MCENPQYVRWGRNFRDVKISNFCCVWNEAYLVILEIDVMKSTFLGFLLVGLLLYQIKKTEIEIFKISSLNMVFIRYRRFEPLENAGFQKNEEDSFMFVRTADNDFEKFDGVQNMELIIFDDEFEIENRW